jgi:hypothetical protein
MNVFTHHGSPRRDFLKGLALMGAAGLVGCGPEEHGAGNAKGVADSMKLMRDLLKDWGDALVRLQVNEPGNPKLHGSFRCPACSEVHGRGGDAVYPLLHLAHRTGQRKYAEAAARVVEWMKNVDAPDGAWTNDLDPKSWKGITVFGAIAMAEALERHGKLLDDAVRERWHARLQKAADYILKTFTIETGNINYPVTATHALILMGRIFKDERYTNRAQELARDVRAFFTQPNQLVFGEGKPAGEKSPRGCLPVDLGYNVEESLSALAQHALLTGDDELRGLVVKSLAAHLEFMLPDGAWDNSWGTRNYKWSYWGSRTSDGCQPGFMLLADRHPAFAAAAFRNTELLRACTKDGLLYGGPHYAAHGAPACVHHTFCHAKALATVLDHVAVDAKFDLKQPLPRESADGVREFPEVATWLLARGPWRGTVTAYDWRYHKNPLLHASGGALSMLWHRDAGPLFAASLTKYELIEAHNMQQDPDGQDFCLTPRVEWRKDAAWFTQILDEKATVRTADRGDEIQVDVDGRLTDAAQKDPPAGGVRTLCSYRIGTSEVHIGARAEGPAEDGTISLVLPLISRNDEKLRRESERCCSIAKPGGRVIVEADAPLAIAPTPSKERVFNLVPGFEAVPFAVALNSRGGPIEVRIRVEKS